MKMIRKTVLAAISLILAISFAGCGTAEEWEPFMSALDDLVAGESAEPAEEPADAPEDIPEDAPEEVSPGDPEESTAGAPEPEPPPEAFPESSSSGEPEEEAPGEPPQASSVLYFAEGANPMVGDAPEYLPSIAFYPDEGAFYLVCNLYEGMGGIKGVYEETDSEIFCTVTDINFKGFGGDDTEAFTLLKNGGSLIFATDIYIGTIGIRTTFDLSEEMPASFRDSLRWENWR